MIELIESLPFELPTIELLIFIATAAVAIAAAVMVVFQRNAMYSALFLVANFFCLAVMYLLLGAYFLAVVQIAGLRRRHHGADALRHHAAQCGATGANRHPPCRAEALRGRRGVHPAGTDNAGRRSQ